MREPKITVLRQSDILSCPYAIIMPEHYDDDGKCRCTDPRHTLMREWGYTWNPDAKRWADNEQVEG